MKSFCPRLQTCWRSLDPFLHPSFYLPGTRDKCLGHQETIRDIFPSPRLREWIKGVPSLIFVRELPVPPLREWNPTLRRTSFESLPSLVFVLGLPIPRLRTRRLPVPPLREWILPLVFMNGALPLIFVIGVPSSITSSILKTFSLFGVCNWTPQTCISIK
ncbi:Hypothetical protein FKW44_015703 [Caligus rogercresseyi]|uniref:Uncharacterized protein n=1 Tax=Caligus rogercresseyi TaxID=217165 RepID=A0A7T8H0R0_CALRO|nr:Hypothetical protein FKW44_015703 [Caligus rogercresseyi]